MILQRTIRRALNAGIDVVRPVIVDEHPHDRAAFTQGLAYHDGQLYESTGLPEASSLRRVRVRTGEVESMCPLEGHWGEGIAVSGAHIVQLTWQSGCAFVYRLEDLALVDRLHYDGEGWGLAARDGGFAMTDGSARLIYRDAAFEITATRKARRNGMGLRWLNDLEYARGSLYVQRPGDRNLLEIDPHSGSVTRLIDCTALWERARPSAAEDVFNGIAYDPTNECFYVTGKRWPLLFRIELPPGRTSGGDARS